MWILRGVEGTHGQPASVDEDGMDVSALLCRRKQEWGGKVELNFRILVAVRDPAVDLSMRELLASYALTEF